MDNLEKYLREHREELDTAKLRDEKWDEIINGFKRKPKVYSLNHWVVAASLLILIAAGLGLYRFYFSDVKESNNLFAEIDSPLSEEEDTFIQLIKNAENLVEDQSIPADYQDLFKDFINQLDVLDRQYEIYKKQITQQGYNGELVQQIIYHYQLKLSVLQMLQQEIEKINELSKVKNNEKVNLTLKM